MQQRHARCCRPKYSSSTITLVETGMSDTLLGNQARAGYGGDNERLGRVCCLLCRNIDYGQKSFQAGIDSI